MATVGGIHQVEGSGNDQSIDALARYAIDEHNKKANADLKLKKVVNVKQQVVAGTMYYITLEATDGDHIKVYEAKIWDKPWENFKQLNSFTLVGDASSTSDSKA
ncbi:Cystatin domain-containing protein [Cephalotus follicularis]|uniref:Cysteine proteinase inhibitor n=1 Tax=Cephalotus follicularis TaxID=3775 RepID=A0A1Q3BK78_CEPFO|nr:Cystatin domain-containing protein [Cephalotus follicularis]